MSYSLVKRLRESFVDFDDLDDAADRIEELEYKLARAVEALGGVQRFVRDLAPYADQGHTLVPALEKACAVYAELKGETNE